MSSRWSAINILVISILHKNRNRISIYKKKSPMWNQVSLSEYVYVDKIAKRVAL